MPVRDRVPTRVPHPGNIPRDKRRPPVDTDNTDQPSISIDQPLPQDFGQDRDYKDGRNQGGSVFINDDDDPTVIRPTYI